MGKKKIVVKKAVVEEPPDWFSVLDKWNATKKGHTRIVEFLVKKHGFKEKKAIKLSIDYQRRRLLEKKKD